MPTYRYRCGACGEELEVWQSFSDTPLTTHEGCSGTLAKVFSPAGIVLKGSGFYKTDSRSNGGRRSSESDKKDSDKKDSETSQKQESTSSGSDSKSDSSSGSSNSGSSNSGSSKSGSSKSGSSTNSPSTSG